MHLGSIVEKGLSIAGSVVGGAVGSGVEAGVDGYKSYEDFKHGQTLNGIVEGGEALLHDGEAVVEGLAGDFF